ncbi:MULTISPECIES: cell division protein FtsQ/DivIB [Sphingomonas]|jgi:cell division protein FtsQ|uniref:Cell division protein FtsQ n=1 Tax=Sphingomonas hankookensis TaxID=563996 RepID=A0ABR5YG14_9SPHN|nr:MULTISPECIES: cell division protein FtsQ/DivIB [Sphingomonas]KZE18612.1 cell division protein FtsQ [Sphingomonas hankookensis]PZT94956.1 MAG: cell division protein FtsQ [Sphingomonas sp.]WCP70494.1 FtsQ-type POTRA domain-containing protein [Sphingomonas hankookensis]
MTQTGKRVVQTRTVKPKRRVQAKRPVRASVLDQAVAALPGGAATARRIVGWSLTAGAGAIALALANWFGLFGAIGVAAAEAVGAAGFRVEQIEVTGLKRMDATSVYAVALDQRSRAMPLVDLDATRQKLLDYGWIADARVSRRLPDTLVVDVVERDPAAVWQNKGQLMLIDEGGVLLDGVQPNKMPRLPLVIGDGANAQEPAYRKLMAAAPALKPVVKAAVWVGNRRWDILFQTGERLVLPEGDKESARALVKFAQLDGTLGLLGKGYDRFDLRDPTKLVVRMKHATPDNGDDGTEQGNAASIAKPVEGD